MKSPVQPGAAFDERVAVKFQLYNGLFLTLPFEDIEDTGMQLPLFTRLCSEQLAEGRTPVEIITRYFKQRKGPRDLKTRIDHLFKILQLVERQVVLFDALEDAAFPFINDLEGPGSLTHLLARVQELGKLEALEKTLEDYRVRVVLTAHPTQFYPDTILGILGDLGSAIGENRLSDIRDLLLQMGKTRFQNRRKPTPLEEATGLLWYLEHIFYTTLPGIQGRLVEALTSRASGGTAAAEVDPFSLPAKVELGFWPGGDRDGNPFVTSAITIEVARRLRESVLRLYLEDLSQLQRRLTFDGVAQRLSQIRRRLRTAAYPQSAPDGFEEGLETAYEGPEALLADLKLLREALITQHSGLFLNQLDDFIRKVVLFGFHFAALDLRQDSRVQMKCLAELLAHLQFDGDEGLGEKARRYVDLSEHEQAVLLEALLEGDLLSPLRESEGLEALTRDSLETISAARAIQIRNGERGLHRFIVSNSGSVSDVLGVLVLARLGGWKANQIKLDVVPLFETIGDLVHADRVLKRLFTLPTYQAHLKRRGNVQTIMLGFSDGTKDGGYITANWAIYQAKRQLTALARAHGIRIVFFDGRGGPPARGGGNTHKFYRSLGRDIAHEEIHLTVQGQTISSNFGTREAARYNMEQLVTAGLENALFAPAAADLNEPDIKLLDRLSKISHDAYLQVRDDSLFLPYLEELTPLAYYGQLNIASRPTRRKATSLRFEDLRAIPFVGAWSQMKQNIPGFYGVGEGLRKLTVTGQKKKLEDLYSRSLFFRTLIENAMMSLLKSNFALTRHLEKDPRFGRLWRRIFKEATLAKQVLKEVTGQQKLLENSPVVRESIHIREKIVLPVLVIQQWALLTLKQIKKDPEGHTSETRSVLEKMVVKSMGAIINAGRNSA